MKCIAFIGTIVFLCFGFNLQAQNNVGKGNTSSRNTFKCFAIGGASTDYGRSIIQTNDGGYAIAGSTASFGAGEYDVYVVKLDNTGAITWTRTIGGTSDDCSYSIVQTSDGGYVVAGETNSFGTGYADVYVVKLDNTGDTLWTRTIGGASDDIGYSIIQTSDGGYVVAGSTKSFGAGYSDVYVVKLDNTGDILWTRTIGGASDDIGYSIIQTSDGGYAIVGYTGFFVTGYADIYVIKLNSSGTLSWTSTIGEANLDFGNSIIQMSDGGYAIVGYTDSFGAGKDDIFVVKLDSSGALNWARTIGGVNNDRGYSIIQTNNGGYVIAGETESFGAGGSDVYVIKLNTKGEKIWTRTIGKVTNDWGRAIIQTNDGGYAIVGTTYFDNIYVVKLDSNGNTCCSTGSGGIVNSVNITDYYYSISHDDKVSTSSPTVGSGGVLGIGGTITNQCP